MDRDELTGWLRLVMTPQIGPTAARKVLAAFGSPQAVFDASTRALQAVVGEAAGKALGAEPEGLDAHVQATLDWLAASPAHAVITLGDADYPARLLEMADPPLLLFAQGRLEALRGPLLAIVGARHPTPQGVDNARAFAAHFSREGWTVVSGLAAGVDGAAHEGALDGPSPTIAIVGTGLDRVYPARHRALAHRIVERGLILSEYLLGTPPLAPNFPKRNRLIAALGQGTLVVEAAVQSGSLITARLAAEMGREVLAIPGSIHNPLSRGCHALIKQGAKLVETAEDVLEELRGGLRPSLLDPAPAADAPSAPSATARSGAGAAGGLPGHTPPRHAADETPGGAPAAADAQERDAAGAGQAAAGPHAALLEALGWDPVHLDALAARTGIGPAALQAQLLELELLGEVARLPGQLFQRVASA
ncbi:MAG: DNA-protecting protein DprA [Burkholderiales bacterium]|nr:DNA-protecting protein DprA [Burkholderiales bacterium]